MNTYTKLLQSDTLSDASMKASYPVQLDSKVSDQVWMFNAFKYL